MPLVANNDRDIWTPFKAEVDRITEEGKKERVLRWCVGHSNGQYIRSFTSEEVAVDFCKILNDRDFLQQKNQEKGLQMTAKDQEIARLNRRIRELAPTTFAVPPAPFPPIAPAMPSAGIHHIPAVCPEEVQFRCPIES